MGLRGMFRPGMRAYFFPLVAGVALIVSAFLPWVVVEDLPLRGFPDTLALWVVGLGVSATLLATLSLITRKNSRHPLLLVGLAALGILFLAWQIMPKTIGDRARTRSQAIAIVENRPLDDPPETIAGTGIYVGLAAAVVIVGFGLTIVVKRAQLTYAVTDPDDDV
jgi:hypothetical protein